MDPEIRIQLFRLNPDSDSAHYKIKLWIRPKYPDPDPQPEYGDNIRKQKDKCFHNNS